MFFQKLELSVFTLKGYFHKTGKDRRIIKTDKSVKR